MIRLLAYLLLIAIGVLAYWFMVRPLLKARPELTEFYAIEGSWWRALLLKFDTIKTKLLAVLLFIASVLVETYDFLLPMATGVDWTPISSRVPTAVWPFVSMAVAAVFYWLRKITADSESQKLVAVQAGVVTADDVIKGDPEALVAVKTTAVPPIDPANDPNLKT